MNTPQSLKLAAAPVMWTNDDMPSLGAEISFETCIAEMAKAGYAGCEIGNKYPKVVEDLLAALKQHSLRICNQWFSYHLTDRPFAETKEEFSKLLNFLYKLGSSCIGGAEQGGSIQGQMDTPVINGRPRFSDEQWKNLTNGLNELGRMAEDKGMYLCYHHHMGTGVESIAETARLLNETDDRYVHLNYDSGHFYFAGQDPLEALKKFSSRTRHVHWKNIRSDIMEKAKNEKLSFLRAILAGVFTVPGDDAGCIDFIPLFEVLKNSGYNGWMVVEAEQDPAKATPIEFATKASKYLLENYPK